MANEGKPVKVPTAPPYLGKHGRRVWRDLYRELAGADLIAAGDMPAFELLCSSFEQCRLANESLAEHGPLIEGTRGTFVRNPAGVQLRESSALFLKLADRFGLTPAAADRLGLGVLE
jgi:P27 family predicted phage terminase small subunit